MKVETVLICIGAILINVCLVQWLIRPAIRGTQYGAVFTRKSEDNLGWRKSHGVTAHNERDDWEARFGFVPYDVDDCGDLFRGKSDLPEDINTAVQEYTTHLNQVMQELQVPREGSTAEYAMAYKAYIGLAKHPSVKTVCETGFNAGFSTFGWLASNPDLHVYSFDIGTHPYSPRMADHLHQLFPGRLNVTWGDSMATLPRFHELNPEVTCDLVIIDGGHTYEICLADFLNFEKMAACDNVVILDNYPQRHMMRPLGDVWESAKRTGRISEIFHCHINNTGVKTDFGCSVGRYMWQC